jgi:DNA-binding MarR family transcriptional regulator
MTTRQEQIMLHLYGRIDRGNEYEMPYQTTQDGIAEAVGISRGHVSIEMKKLEEKGLVTHLQRHAYTDRHRSRTNRFCYKLETLGILTVKGMLEASREVA